MELGTNFWDVGWGGERFIGEPVDEAHKYRALRDYVIKTGQYDAKTGAARRISGKSVPSK